MRLDRREIKSFRLRYRIEILKNIINVPLKNSIFITLNNTTPLKLKKELLNENIQLTAISQNTVKMLCNNFGLKLLKNSLSGNVYAIYKTNNEALNYEAIIKNNAINFHFLISNNIIYRNKEDIIKPIQSKNVFFNFYKMEILKPLFLLEMIKKTQ